MQHHIVKNLEDRDYFTDGFVVRCIVNIERVRNAPAIFEAIIDSGAQSVCVSSKTMTAIIEATLTSDDSMLEPIGQTKAAGLDGVYHTAYIYCVPLFSFDRITLKDLLVIEVPTLKHDCLIGRYVLHQCLHSFNPKENSLTVDFSEGYRSEMPTICGHKLFKSATINLQSEANSAIDHNELTGTDGFFYDPDDHKQLGNNY